MDMFEYSSTSSLSPSANDHSDHLETIEYLVLPRASPPHVRRRRCSRSLWSEEVSVNNLGYRSRGFHVPRPQARYIESRIIDSSSRSSQSSRLWSQPESRWHRFLEIVRSQTRKKSSTVRWRKRGGKTSERLHARRLVRARELSSRVGGPEGGLACRECF